MIAVVLFDFGGVLTESGKKGFIGETIAGLYGISPESVDISDLHGDLRRGKTGEETFFRKLNERYGSKIQITQKMFLDKVHEAFAPSPKVYDLAKRLREHGIQTAILSNIFDMNAQLLREQGWYDGFDPLILSCDEGFAKPDPEIYATTIKRLGVHPEEILFIDDQEKCLPPAEDLGMHTIRAVSAEQIVADTEVLIRNLNGITL
ncbi:MAG: HAD family phosphatase [Candidatus Saccharimonadales bacterium]